MRARVKSPICRGGSVLPLLPFRVKMFRISMKGKKKKMSRSFFPSGIFPGTGRIPLVSSTPTSSNTSSAEEKPCPTQLLPKQELSRAPHGMTVFHSNFRKTEAKKSFTTTAHPQLERNSSAEGGVCCWSHYSQFIQRLQDSREKADV